MAESAAFETGSGAATSWTFTNSNSYSYPSGIDLGREARGGGRFPAELL